MPNEGIRPKRPRKLPAALDNLLVEAPVEQHNDTLDTLNGYRTQVFCPIVDRMVEELQRRFSSKNEIVYNGVDALCSTSDTFFDQTALQKFVLHYKEVVFESNDNDSNLLQLKNEIVATKFLLEDKLRKMQTQHKKASLSVFIH